MTISTTTPTTRINTRFSVISIAVVLSFVLGNAIVHGFTSSSTRHHSSRVIMKSPYSSNHVGLLTRTYQASSSSDDDDKEEEAVSSSPVEDSVNYTTTLDDAPEAYVQESLDKAREILEKARAKIAAQQQQETTSAGDDENTKSSTTKATNGETVVNNDEGNATPNNEESSAPAPLPFFMATQKTTASRESVIKKDKTTGLITTDGEAMAKLSEKEEWAVRSLLDVFDKNEVGEEGDAYSLAAQQLSSRDVAASIQDLRKKLQMGDYKKIFDKSNRFIGEDN